MHVYTYTLCVMRLLLPGDVIAHSLRCDCVGKTAKLIINFVLCVVVYSVLGRAVGCPRSSNVCLLVMLRQLFLTGI